MSITINIQSGSRSGQSLKFQEGKILIGRSPTNTVCLAEPMVSGMHAEISYQDGRWLLRDLGSTNGTWLGVQRIQQHALQNGDTIDLGPGGPRLQFWIEAAAYQEPTTEVPHYQAPPPIQPMSPPPPIQPTSPPPPPSYASSSPAAPQSPYAPASQPQAPYTAAPQPQAPYGAAPQSQPAYAAPPGYYPPTAAQPKKSSRMVLFVVLALVGVFVVGGGIGAWFLFSRGSAAIGEVDKSAERFFSQLKQHNYSAIYDESSQPFRSKYPRESIVDLLKRTEEMGELKTYNRSGIKMEYENSILTARLSYQTEFDRGSGPFSLKFVDEKGEWKLIEFEFNIVPNRTEDARVTPPSNLPQQSSQDDAATAVDMVAEEFFNRLRSGNYDEIYDNLAGPFKRQYSREQILAELRESEKAGKLRNYQRINLKHESEGGYPIIRVTYQTQFEGGSGPFELKLIKMANSWEILGFDYKVR